MAARDKVARRRNAAIAADVKWACTPNRTEATAAARAKSPVSFEYWLAWAADQHPDMDAAGQIKAAQNAHRAHQRRVSAKAVKARAANRERKTGRAAA